MMSTSSRFFDPGPTTSRPLDTHGELIASLTRINTYNPPVQTCSTGWTFHGLYAGPTSVAYLFFRLSQLYPDLMFKGQSLQDWAEAYLALGSSRVREKVDANHCGIGSEVLSQVALRAAVEQDPSLAQSLCSWERVINDKDTTGSNEWLYGRAGYLYLLRLTRSAFLQDARTLDLINRVIEKTVQRILSAQQPWLWHDKNYLGAVHGTFGILYQIAVSSPSSAPTLEPMVSDLLSRQFHSGNFPSSLPVKDDKLVQFCHGSPGVVLCLRSLRPYLPGLHDRIDSAITKAQTDIQTRGILLKDPCLCHGITGNALALDNPAHFERFLSLTSSLSLEKHGWLTEAGLDDDFVGLFIGEAGRAWLWAVAEKGIERTCTGFNDL